MDESAAMSSSGSLHNVAASHTGHERDEPVKGLARHTVGLLLLLCVVFLWTAGNFLGSSVLSDESYAKPFFITYLNTASFVIMMVPSVLREMYKKYRNGTLRSTARYMFSKQMVRAFLGRETDLEASYHSEREALLKPNGDDMFPTTAVINAASSTILPEEPNEYLPFVDTARMALAFCILWFGANYFTMACLEYTTVASTTILTSTSSVWTLLVGAITRTEKFTWRKFCGVVASFCGIVLISSLDFTSGSTDEPMSHDTHPDERGLSVSNFTFRALIATTQHLTKRAISEFPDKTVGELALGDAFALLSAIIYGFYVIALKHTTLKIYPLNLYMPNFFGLVGLFNCILLLPLFPILHFTGWEHFAWPPTGQIWAILIMNSLSSLLSDITWAYAMVFTSPLVVTVGLSLTIPVSLVGEMIIQGRYEGWFYWVGAMVVVGSFVFVEREEVKEEQEIVEEFARRTMDASLILGVAGNEDGSGGVDPADLERRLGKQRAKDDLAGLNFDDEEGGRNTYVDIDTDRRSFAGPSNAAAADRQPWS